MFERQISEILQRVLGAYFDGIDTESLNVSLLGGRVELEDLRLRREAITALGLPFSIKHGRVRRVELELSLRNLRGAPARMRIDGVEVVLDVNEDVAPPGGDPEAERAERTQRLLDDLEHRRLALLSTGRGGAAAQTASTMARMVAGFINNLVVEVTDVDIRCDAPASNRGLFTIGIRWRSASLTTTDADWRPCVAAADAACLFKQATIVAFCMYTRGSPAAPQAASSHILAPVDVLMRASLAVAAPSSFDRPLVSVDVRIGAAKLAVTAAATIGAAHLLERLALSSRRREHVSARPASLATSYRGHYAEWWRYAVDVTRRQLRARRHAWLPANLSANAKRLAQYAPLFRRALNLLPLPALDKSEEATMRQLEEEMPDSMLMAIRGGVQSRLQLDAREALAQARVSVCPCLCLRACVSVCLCPACLSCPFAV